MSHVDEGTLHALLDGELAPAEVLDVQTHFATCPACSSRLDAARKLLAETERLVTALEPASPLGGQLSARFARPAAEPPRSTGAPARPTSPAAAAPAPAPVAGPPRGLAPNLESLVLIPNNPTATEVRRSRLRVLGWAAAFLVVVSGGILGIQARMGLFDKKPAGMLKIRPEEFSSPAATDQDGPVAGGTASAAAAGAPSSGTSPAVATNRAAGAAGVPATAPGPTPAATSSAPAPPPAQPARQPTATPDLASRTLAKPAPAPAAAPKPVAATAADTSIPQDDRDAIAARAAKATEELDRDLTRERAAAATAALDAERRAAARQPAANAAPTPAPPPVPTVDQRARISSRIGLDEAAHQLGGPLHAIDGMSRLLVGTVSPQLVPGSDTTRAVVRAVYVDRTGRLIFLDQQRVRAGQSDLPFTPTSDRSGELRWMSGQVLLVLQSDVPTDSLRFLWRRVR
jgi:putative zinc finger protein